MIREVFPDLWRRSFIADFHRSSERHRALESRRAGHKKRLRAKIRARRRRQGFQFSAHRRKTIAATFPDRVGRERIATFLDQAEDLIRWFRGEPMVEPERREQFELLGAAYHAAGILEKHLSGASPGDTAAAARFLGFLEGLPAEVKAIGPADISRLRRIVRSMKAPQRRGRKVDKERIRELSFVYNLSFIYEQAAGRGSRGRMPVLRNVVDGARAGVPQIGEDSLKAARALARRLGVDTRVSQTWYLG